MNFYPFYSELQEVSKNFNNGNFSLWFNKIIFEVDENFKLINDTNWAKNILKKYQEISKKELKVLLDKKNKSQEDYCKYLSNSNIYKLITFKAKLKSDLIIGLGETHSTELGMILDHNLGISYIPASTIKGAVRFSYSLNYIDNNKDLPTKEEYIKEEKKYITVLKEKDTPITKLFGGDNLLDNNNYVDKIGKIFFLDSYSEKVPKLKLDVMTPHYGDYYKDNKTAPADNQDPNPLKFLVIERGQTFIFNILIDSSVIDEKDNIISAFKRALEVEGIGAKTSIGYGRFVVEIKLSKDEQLKHDIKKYLEDINKKQKPSKFFDKWQKDNNLKDNKKIAEAFLTIANLKEKKKWTKQARILSKILDIEKSKLLEMQNNI